MSDAALSDAQVVRRYEAACDRLARGKNNDPYYHNAKSQANWERWHAEVVRRGLMGQVRLK